MKKSLRYILLIFIIASTTGCNPKWDFDQKNFEPQLVIDGWIENGDVAYVCLTQTRPLFTTVDSMMISEIPIRWAKVTVSDGETEEILTGRIDKRYIPPYVYRGNILKGIAGKTYTLTVEYSGITATATTTIPQPVPLERLEVSRCDNSDTLFQIKAYLNDIKNQKNYYKFFTRVVNNETRFYSSFMGTFEDNAGDNGEIIMSVFKGIRYTHIKKFTPFYMIDDTVEVKFTQIPRDGFLFWNSYESDITNGNNPLFPSSSNLVSNIRNGLGIWCGYGISVYPLIIREEIKKQSL